MSDHVVIFSVQSAAILRNMAQFLDHFLLLAKQIDGRDGFLRVVLLAQVSCAHMHRLLRVLIR